ncbi:MAG TPA: cytochrome c biogenesis protein CcdA [Nitrososphaerales archaeon]
MSFFEQVPLALVLGAGFVTLLSPCGYALLPGLIGYLLGGKVSIRGAVRGALTAIFGVLLVFAAVGIILSIASGLIRAIVPHLTIGAAVIIMTIGIAKIFELNLPVIGNAPSINIKPTGFFTYGIAYAFAGAGCTFPIFFAVLLYASTVPGIGALATMLTYSVGLAVPLLITSVLTATANDAIVHRIARLTGKIQRVSGSVLLAAGVYLIYSYLTSGALLPN